MNREIALALAALGTFAAWLYSRPKGLPAAGTAETTPYDLPNESDLTVQPEPPDGQAGRPNQPDPSPVCRQAGVSGQEQWSRDDLIELLRTSAVKYEIPPELLINLAIAESNLDPNAVGVTGDIGILQLNPKYHPTGQATDPVWAIDYGAKYLKSLYKQTGSWENALIAYNWGIGNFQKHGPEAAPESTKNYVEKILG